MKVLALGIVIAGGIAVMAAVQTAATKPLQIYVVDTEGGKATLYVSPTGQTALVDSGNPGGRDTDRIMAVLADAGVTPLAYLVSTHYHVDHIRGLPELAKRSPLAAFVDPRPSVDERG